MNFDYTYIVVGGFLVFEPMIIVSNSILFVLSLIFFFRLRQWKSLYAANMRRFMLMVGIGGIFGAICHSVHYQNGKPFFNLMLFGMNGFSLLGAHFCAKAGYFLQTDSGNRKILLIWNLLVAVLLVYAFVLGDFTIVKVVAGVALLYTLIIHLNHYRVTRSSGSLYVLYAIASSVVSLLVHSARITLDEWFNYKDLAHVFMIVAQVLFYTGSSRNALWLEKTRG